MTVNDGNGTASQHALTSLLTSNLSQIVDGYAEENVEESRLLLSNAVIVEQEELLPKSVAKNLWLNEPNLDELEQALSTDNQASPLYNFRQVYLVVKSAPSYIASLLRENDSVSLEQATESWTLQTMFYLSMRKSQRQRIFLIDQDDLVGSGSSEYLRQDSYLLIANKLHDTKNELQKLNGLLLASCMPLCQQPKSFISLDTCLHAIRSEKSYLDKLGTENADLKHSITSLKEQSATLTKKLDEANEALKQHDLAKKVLEDKFASLSTSSEQTEEKLKEENSLLLQQLHIVQESIEQHVNEKLANEKKVANLTSDLKKAQGELASTTKATQTLEANNKKLKLEHDKLAQQLQSSKETLEQQSQVKIEAENKLKELTDVLKDTQEKLEVALAKNQSTEVLQQKYQAVKEENDLLLQQLHIVQESLEEAYNKRKSLLERLHPSLKVASEDASLLDDVVLIAQSQFFNALWYLDQNPDLELAGLNPAQHYLYIGYLEGKEPSPEFSGAQYYKAHPDVAESKMNPLFHYEKHGKHEDRAISLEQSDSF